MGRAHDHRQFLPVAEVPYCDEITKAIEAFGAAAKLPCLSYYHDLPLWIVHEPDGRERRIRQLQVVAYLVSRRPYISFVPAVHFVVGAHRLKIPKQTPTIRRDLADFLNGDEFDEQIFLGQLQTAWERSRDLEYSADQLVEIEVSTHLNPLC